MVFITARTSAAILVSFISALVVHYIIQKVSRVWRYYRILFL